MRNSSMATEKASSCFIEGDPLVNICAMCPIIFSLAMVLPSIPNKIFNLILKLKITCYQYNGIFSLLWHNSSFSTSCEAACYKQIVTNGSDGFRLNN